jgi:RNA polymerase sigma factor (sigma-70 family)
MPSRQDRDEPATAFDEMVTRVLSGDGAAWREFVARVHPTVVEICEHHRFVGGFAGSEDVARDVAVRALDRLRESDFAALRSFVETRSRHASASFVRWLAVVVTNTYVDYLRAQPEYQRRRVESSRRLRRIPHEVLDSESQAGRAVDPMTAVEIRRIVDCMASDLFPQPQRMAIAMWLRGNDADDIARDLELPGGREEARKLLETARQRLRRAVHGGKK